MVLLGYLWISFEIDRFGGVDVARDVSDQFRIQPHPAVKLIPTPVE